MKQRTLLSARRAITVDLSRQAVSRTERVMHDMLDLVRIACDEDRAAAYATGLSVVITTARNLMRGVSVLLRKVDSEPTDQDILAAAILAAICPTEQHVDPDSIAERCAVYAQKIIAHERQLRSSK